MKQPVIILFFFFSTFSIFGQISYEQGYVVKNNGEKISCFIKDLESLRTPTKFEYKINISDKETITGDIQSIQEFGIPAKFKYKRQTVEIDTENHRVTTQRNPVFETKTVFTKVLVEGEASLFSYFDGETVSFFYTLKSKDINSPKTLVYKEFITHKNTLRKNDNYKQELMNNLVCENLNQKDFENIDYFQNSLLQLFIKYNSCLGGNYEIFKEKRKGIFNLKIAPRIAFNSLFTGIRSDNRLDTQFDNKTQFFVGVEFEYIMSFNKNKWSVFIDPTYQYFKQEDVEVGYNDVLVSIDYSSVEVPIGIRHYMFLNDTSKIFVNFGFVVDLVLNNKFEYTLVTNFNEPIFSTPNFTFGLGYNFNNKFDIEYLNIELFFVLLRYNFLIDIFLDRIS